MDFALQLTDVCKRFGSPGLSVLESLSFAVRPGEIFALLGPSGCGKTTALRIIAGFEKAETGAVRLNDSILQSSSTFMPPEKRGIGFVFQDYALFPHLSVLDNVAFGLRGLSRRDARGQAQSVLAKVGLTEKAAAVPSELSGGQQQRVALARALIARPRLILLDEAFSNLDPVLRESTRHEVRNLLKDAGMTTVIVTHDQEEALSFSDRVAVMNQGRIEQIGRPEEIYDVPRTRFVAEFLGKANFIEGHADGCMAETALGRLRLNRPAWGPVQISIRPEHLTLKPSHARAGRPSGHIISRSFKGHDITYQVGFPDRQWIVHTESHIRFEPGDEALISARQAAVVLDDSEPKPDGKVASTPSAV
jgi:iron(III) transport system ATP-binding protein